jgi:hypothetical protein
MTATPVRSSARDRLRDAQQAEVRALKDVDAATRTRARAAKRLDDADAALAKAQAAVAATSGLERAAYLLDLQPAELRRRVRTVPSNDD